ncbi:MAG: hypothetical protein Q4C00_07225 [Bacillota bacterium]|nr:hypothetical protein [Bacillota bacterium]
MVKYDSQEKRQRGQAFIPKGRRFLPSFKMMGGDADGNNNIWDDSPFIIAPGKQR